MIQTCKVTGKEFEITDEDLEFYKKVSPKIGGKVYEIPPPTLCPEEREKMRIAWRNERNLYKRECEGCQKQMVSIYSPEKDYHVWCQSCWWSDKWDPINVGRDFDFNRSFFDQFNDLIHDSKLITLFGKNNENSEFVNQEADNKNCYMNAGGHFNEDCYYNTYSIWGKNNVDNYWVIKSELLYECIKSERCFSSTYLQYCENCSDCHYCMDCKGCTNCFGSYGLRHKKYYFFNKSLSQEEYKQKVSTYLSSYESRKSILPQTQKHFLKYPRKSFHLINCTDSRGDDLLNCKNVIEGYLFENSQDTKYIYIGLDVKDGIDLSSFGWGEVLYNCASSIELNNVMCVTSTTNLNFSQYCFVCFNSSNIFGCVGLNRKKYCILNKQCTKEEYEELVPKIIEHMRTTGEWGEFFPIELSPFAYNETVAQEYYPLMKEEILQKGYTYKEESTEIPNVEKIIPANKLPDSIKDIPDDILNWAIECEESKKPFKIQKAELDFYRKQNLPVPHFHPDIRHQHRMKLRNPRKLFSRTCDKCQKPIETTFAPERPETVYCEGCYLEVIQ